MKRRRAYDDNFQARVTVEAIEGVETISEIASPHEVHPNQVVRWKKRLLENVADVFSRKEDPGLEEQKKRIEALYRKIGRVAATFRSIGQVAVRMGVSGWGHG